MKTLLFAVIVFAVTSLQALADPTGQHRHLNLTWQSTGERLTTIYSRNGRPIDEEIDKVNHFLRDRSTGDSVDMDIKLLNILSRIQDYYGVHRPITVLSAYRTVETNKQTEGAAENSMHIKGRAVDISIPGVSARSLAEIARRKGAGGIGIYRNSIHIDTGRKGRRW